MKKYQEIEEKYPLHNNNEVQMYLININANWIVKNQIQIDTYFIPAHRNFLSNPSISEWLRIRETEESNSLNYKRWLPIGAVNKTHCDEFETDIENVDATNKIFEALDFKEIIKVNKKRNSWLFEDLEISIDDVENLGYFIELESIENITEDKIEIMHLHIKETLKKIGAKVGKEDHRGYPYMLLDLNEKQDN